MFPNCRHGASERDLIVHRVRALRVHFPEAQVLLDDVAVDRQETVLEAVISEDRVDAAVEACPARAFPSDFGTPAYSRRRAKALTKHLSAIAETRAELLRLFDSWLAPSAGLRQYLGAHRRESIETARKLIELIAPTVLKTVLGYLILHYWGHRSGWPDLLVYRPDQAQPVGFMILPISAARSGVRGCSPTSLACNSRHSSAGPASGTEGLDPPPEAVSQPISHGVAASITQMVPSFRVFIQVLCVPGTNGGRGHETIVPEFVHRLWLIKWIHAPEHRRSFD